jgi:primosomal protein N' (replication factor Y)
MKKGDRCKRMFVEVIINNNAKALNRTFDYSVPKELENLVHIGSRVSIPFGRNKTSDDGFVINIKK